MILSGYGCALGGFGVADAVLPVVGTVGRSVAQAIVVLWYKGLYDAGCEKGARCLSVTSILSAVGNVSLPDR